MSTSERPIRQNDPAKFRIVEVSTGVLIGELSKVGFLSVHPHLSFATSGATIALTPDCKTRQEKTIPVCLTLAKNNPPAGCSHTHFTIMPELNLPNNMLGTVEQILASEDWPPNTVVISGVEPAEIELFREMVQTSNNPLEAKQLTRGSARFANFCVVWLKDGNGRLLRYIQPKLRPSAPEQATQGMYEGDLVFLFHTDLLSFTCFICFDLVAEDACMPIVHSILDGVAELGSEGRSVNLDLILVPQCNPSPEHPRFIQFANDLLYRGGSKVRTTDSAVAFVNSAAPTFGRALTTGYGRSAIYYRQGRWQSIGKEGPISDVPPTFALEMPPVQKYLVRARFREDGPCVHRFGYIVPSLAGGTAGSPRYPLVGACHHKILQDGSVGPGEQVPALSKIVSDWIAADSIREDARLRCSEAIRALVSQACSSVQQELESAHEERIGQITDILFVGFDPPNRRPKLNPDSWQHNPQDWHSEVHGQALLEVVSVCIVLGVLAPPSLVLSEPCHTGHVLNLYFAVLDGHERKSYADLLGGYFRWISEVSWKETAGRSNLIVMTRVERDGLKNGVIQEVPKPYYQPDIHDEDVIPAPLRTHPDSILEEGTKWYWHVATSLRSVFDCGSIEEARTSLRGKLGPLAPA